jgi:hypothetical protein
LIWQSLGIVIHLTRSCAFLVGISNCILRNIGVSVRVLGSSGIFATKTQCPWLRAASHRARARNLLWRAKQRNISQSDFRELCEDCMLIHHGEMVAILLHGFVPSTKALEHLQTLGYLFRYGSTISRSCFRESRMALFGHKFCRFDITVDRSAPFHCPNSVYACYNLNNFFSHDAWFSFFQVPAPYKKC